MAHNALYTAVHDPWFYQVKLHGMQGISPSDVALFDQKDIRPSHAELELWIASGSPDLDIPRRRTPVTMAIMEGDRVVRQVLRWKRATNIPSADDIFLLRDRLPEKEHQAMVQKREEYRAIQRTRTDRDGWVVKITTSETILFGHTRWAIVKHRPDSLQVEPSVVPIADLGHHLLAPVRSVLRNDRVVVVDGEEARAAIGRVVEVKESAGTVTIASSFFNDAEELVEVRINNVDLQFFVNDVVEVTEGPHHGRVGFITHVSPGIVDICDTIQNISRSWPWSRGRGGRTAQLVEHGCDRRDRHPDGVLYDHEQDQRTFHEVTRVGDTLVHKEVNILGGRHGRRTAQADHFKGRQGTVTAWDPRPLTFSGVQTPATLKRFAALGGTRAMLEGARITVRIENHVGPPTQLPIERLSLRSSTAAEPVMLIDSVNAHRWQPWYRPLTLPLPAVVPPLPPLAAPLPPPPFSAFGDATPLWPSGAGSSSPDWQPEPALLVLAGEEDGQWLCLPSLVGKRVDVILCGLPALVGKKHVMVGARLAACEGKCGHLLIQQATYNDLARRVQHGHLDKHKIFVYGFKSTHATPVSCVRPCRVLGDGRRLEDSTERVVILGADCEGRSGEWGLYAQVIQPQDQNPPGTVLVHVARPGGLITNRFPLPHLCFAKNVQMALQATIFSAMSF
ncbi:hypothetical protein DFH07DRAFT_782551 [Mycena maculata]|uniref:KOW domain-containing protein n=1 Tax=Mycena maculata TaxID=230809 RepID=A0AAD7HS87_9AGAR|nr:hypothetical protein DFH07DRAFT_782551 [Mycena maculata]